MPVICRWRRSSQFVNRSSSVPRVKIHNISVPHSSSPLAPEIRKSGSLRKWITGIAVGSSLGVLVLSDTSSDVDKRLSSLTDWSMAITESKSDDRSTLRSSLPKQSLPDYCNSKFILGEAYRRKIFFKYEKRLRLRSPPEKVFEYFSSIRKPGGELLMNPADLMRAIVPVFPPSESHLVRDGYLIGERNPGDLRCAPSEFFMLFDMDHDGLISFKEYIFFVTLLSIPESSFSVAFKMFDVDKNGEIDREEFKKVMALMRGQNRQGAVHRNGLRTGLKVTDPVENGGLIEYFFGKDGKESLHHDKFVKFMKDLHDEMLRLEFAHYDSKGQGTISAKDYALSMAASADISNIEKLLARVDEIDNKPYLRDIRFSMEEFKQFAELRRKLQPLSLALFSYGKVNGLLTREDFRRAASHVCGMSLSDNVVELTFHMFDSNRDGNLSVEEFLQVLHRREREIAQPVGTGLSGFLSYCRLAN